MVEEDAAVEAAGEVDLEGEAALVDEVGAGGKRGLSTTGAPRPASVAATAATLFSATPSTGVALGLDRLVMLALGLDDIEKAVPFRD